MSADTQDCICCRIESDCINGFCEMCSDFDYKQRKPKTLQLRSMDGAIQTVTVPEIESEEYKLQKQADLLTLGLLQEKNKVTELEDIIQRILNEDFTGQTTLSGYMRREAKKIMAKLEQKRLEQST